MTEALKQSLYQFFDFIRPIELWLFKNINQSWTAAWSNEFFPVFTDLNFHPWFKYAVPIGVLLILSKKYKMHAVTLVVFAMLCIGWSDFTGGRIKSIVERPRPFQSIEVTSAIQRSPAKDNRSFYSNHSSNNFAFASFISFFMPSLSWLFYALAGLVGYSRVYNGVHYPSDVLFGAFIGVIWGKAFSHMASRFLTTELRNKVWKDFYKYDKGKS